MGRIKYAWSRDYDAIKPLLDSGKMVPAQSIQIAIGGEVDFSSVVVTILKNQWGWYAVYHPRGGFEVEDWEGFKSYMQSFQVSCLVPLSSEGKQ